MATILVLAANTLVDCLGNAAILPGRVNRLERFFLAAGGKAFNAGRVLASHGHRVIAAGFAGGWSGALLRGLLQDDGLESLLVNTAARTRLGFQVFGDEHRSTAVLENGFAVSADEARQLVEAIQSRLSCVDLVLIGGSVPDASCNALYERVLTAGAQARVPGWIDSYGPAMEQALRGAVSPSLIKVNRQEYGDGRHFHQCSEVHVTDGPNAINVRCPSGFFRVTPPIIKERNAVGSGDSYFAALAHARLQGWSMETQLRYAAAAGAANAVLGAVAHLNPQDIEPWVEHVKVTFLGTDADEAKV